MSEKTPILRDKWLTVNTANELINVFPEDAIERLGGAEVGVNNLKAILIGLTPFAPEPADFDRNAFDALVAYDELAGSQLPPEKADIWFSVALDYGLIEPSNIGDGRVAVSKNLQDAVKRAFPEEE
jgi:hypothetical protein